MTEEAGPAGTAAAPTLAAQAIGLSPEQIVDRIDEILQLRYRSAPLGNFKDPLAEAVYIILSQQTREQAYQATFAELRDRYPTWSEMAKAPQRDLEEILRPTGFHVNRARTIQRLLVAVEQANTLRGAPGVYSLDYLRQMPDGEMLSELVALPGLGDKSARCIMSYSLDRPVFAVDTHVRRIFDRLKLVEDPGGKVKHGPYEAIVPASARKRLHMNLVHHGRQVCGSRPRCSDCPLISFCELGQQKLVADKRPVAVELFAGAGGLALGFSRAGFRVAVAVEMDRDAAQTHRANHPGTVVLERNVEEITHKHIRAVAPWMADVTAVIGGPPCQGYSVAGKRDPDDKKNRLFEQQVRIAKGLKSRFVVIENVLGMRNIRGVSFPDAVEQALREANYHARHDRVRASDYGVPQLRHRLIFTAQLVRRGDAPIVRDGDYCGSLESPCRCGRPKTPSVLEVLDLPGLPRLAHGQDAEYYVLGDGTVLLNGSTMHHGKKVIDKIASIAPGKGPISYRRLHSDLARTIVAGHRALPVHPFLDRTISVREAARIQGFPDDYVFAGSRGKQPLQVANAVPPALGEAVALSLKEVMEGKHAHAEHVREDLCGRPAVQLAFPIDEAGAGHAGPRRLRLAS